MNPQRRILVREFDEKLAGKFYEYQECLTYTKHEKGFIKGKIHN